jgi:hypothetical protein
VHWRVEALLMKAKGKKVKPAKKTSAKKTLEAYESKLLEPRTLVPDAKGRSRRLQLLAAFVFVACVALLNLVSSTIAAYLSLPLFLDTWATSAAVIIGGLWAGTTGGMLYNIIMTYLLWSPSSWVWMFSSAWVAFATWMLYKDGWISISRPKNLLLAGATVGITNTFIVISISLLAFGAFPAYVNTLYIQTAINSVINYSMISSFITTLLANIVDKIITVTFAALVVAYMPRKYKTYFRKI